MPWPRVQNFGIIDNPLIDSPFVAPENIKTAEPPPPGNLFLLLNGGNFLLLNGDNLALL